MASFISLLIIALSVSLDGCSVGLLYGARGIRIPAGSLLVISGCSGLLLFLSMLVGDWLAHRLAPEAAMTAGAFILVAVGLWAIIQFFRSGKEDRTAATPAEAADVPAEQADVPAEQANVPAEAGVISAPPDIRPQRFAERMLFRLELRKLGFVIQILRTPSAADMDRSGNISPAEAALLGIALSLDAIGAGFGAALVGYGAFTTALCITAASGAFVWLGTVLGRRVAGRLGRKLAVLPGFLLICVGILKLFHL